MTELFVAVNAKYPHTNLAVRLLCAEVQKTGLACAYIEHTINTEKHTIAADIISRTPEVVSFSCYIWNITDILEIISLIKTMRPELQILLGGPEVSFDAQETLAKFPDVNYIIRGEGEQAHVDFARFLLGQKSLTACASLVYREGGKISANPVAVGHQFENADFPYRDLSVLKNRVIYYEASRGCPFACAFCLSSEAGVYRDKPLDIVKRDILLFIQADLKIVKLVDRTFNTNKARAIALLEFIMANSRRTCFHLELAPSLLDDALIETLAKAKPGIFQLEIGIQSTHKETLTAINRREDFAAFAPDIRRLTQLKNMHIHVDLIAGLPFEDLPRFQQSFDDVFLLGADNLQLGFLKLLKGAPLREKAESFGIQYQESAPYEVISTPWLSSGDLAFLESIEYLLKRIYNSGLYKYTSLMLAESMGSGFRLFSRIHAKLQNQNLSASAFSEAALLDFLWRFCKENEPLAGEMLLFEAMNKRKRPRLPEHILTPERRNFRKRYFKENSMPEHTQKPQYPIRFSFDVLEYAASRTLKKKPVVLIFDYSDFSYGVRIRRG